MLALLLLLLSAWPLLASADSTSASDTRGVWIPGDIILGGLFPVHEKSSDQSTPCSHKIYNRGIQRLEAMLYAVDTINNDSSILNGVKLGVNILDTCGMDTYALNQSLEFIRASLNSFDVNQYECEYGSAPRLKFNTTGPVKGVIGGSYSSVSIQVANLLRLFRIPQISPASTAKALSDKSRFEMFARTVPPDTFQAIALVDIVKKFNWTYVSTIASEGSYGESGIDVFQREADRRNICIAIAEKVPSKANQNTFRAIVQKLLKKPQAKVVVLFTRAEDARGILMAARELSLKGLLPSTSSAGSGFFTWLASDGWGKQKAVVADIQDFAVGAITVELESKRIQGFDDYMNRLTPRANKRNFWFRDYWQEIFNCRVPEDDDGGDGGDGQSGGGGGRRYLGGPGGGISSIGGGGASGAKLGRHAFAKTCDPRRKLGDLPGYEQDSKVQFVIDAVYAFAYALERLRADVCPGWRRARQRGICAQMAHYDGGQFYKDYLLKVDFVDIANSTVKFDSKGDGLPRYTIYNYQKDETTGATDYKVIGKWHSELDMNVDDVMWTIDVAAGADEDLSTAAFEADSNLTLSAVTLMPPQTSTERASVSTLVPVSSSSAVSDGRSIPTSVCSLPCKAGEIMIMNTGDTCCWVCQKCQPFEYVKDVHTCEDCGRGRWPMENYTTCFDLELQYMRWETVFAIVPLCICGVGILLTIVTFAIFFKHRDTPLVRASGRELSYVILAGLLVCFLNTYILLAKPGTVVCLLQRFTVGMGFSAMYGALLTKTNRIARIFQSATKTTRRPSYISPKSQLMITLILVSVQFCGTLVWTITAFPGAQRVYPRRDEVILKCNVDNSSFLISQVYNMLLIAVCTYYAIRTRKVPENFNEAKFIGFTMYTTCIIWLAFIPIYFGTGNSFEIQITTLCISISLSAYVTLFCMFSPKLYIIVFQPEKNVRKLTMNSATTKKNTTSLISTAATAAIVANAGGGARLQFAPAAGGGICFGGGGVDSMGQKSAKSGAPGGGGGGGAAGTSPKPASLNSGNPAPAPFGTPPPSATSKKTIEITTAATITPPPSAPATGASVAGEEKTNVTVNQLPPSYETAAATNSAEKQTLQPDRSMGGTGIHRHHSYGAADVSSAPPIKSALASTASMPLSSPNSSGHANKPSQTKRISFTMSLNDEKKSATVSPAVPAPREHSTPTSAAATTTEEEDDDEDEEEEEEEDATSSSRPGTPCSTCEKHAAAARTFASCQCEDCVVDSTGGEANSKRTNNAGDAELKEFIRLDDDTRCNGGVAYHRRTSAVAASTRVSSGDAFTVSQSEHNTPCKPTKTMATNTGDTNNAGKWLGGRAKRFASLPRSGGRASSSSTRLLLDDGNVDASTSSQDLTNGGGSGNGGVRSRAASATGSPRHLMTYVNSSHETIPLEINQDIPDVML